MACPQNSGLIVLRDAPWRNRRNPQGADAPTLGKWAEDSGVRSILGKPQTEKFARASGRD